MMSKRATAIFLIVLCSSLWLPAGSTGAIMLGQPMNMAEEATADKRKTSGGQLPCLPDTFDLTEVIAYRTLPNGKEVKTRLKDRLVELKATCRDGKLVDQQRREIKLFRFACFGNPPADYDEIQQKEQQELSQLKKHYTVILIQCNPRIQ
jgi:hypothetical protein